VKTGTNSQRENTNKATQQTTTTASKKKKKKKKTEENDKLWTFDWPTTILFYEMVVKVVKSP